MYHSFVFFHQSGSKENNLNTNVKPYLCTAIICSKSVTNASLLHEITLSLTMVKYLACLPISLSCAPYNSWQEHFDKTTHMENLDRFFGFQNHTSLCICFLSSLPQADFLTQLVPAAPKVRGHVTFSWPTTKWRNNRSLVTHMWSNYRSCCLYVLFRFPLPRSPLQTAQHICTLMTGHLSMLHVCRSHWCGLIGQTQGIQLVRTSPIATGYCICLIACCNSWVIVLHVRLACRALLVHASNDWLSLRIACIPKSPSSAVLSRPFAAMYIVYNHTTCKERSSLARLVCNLASCNWTERGESKTDILCTYIGIVLSG